MDVRITPKRLAGTVTPSSKSMAHRAILAAALARGTSVVKNLSFSQDIQATMRCVEEFRCNWEQMGADALKIHGLYGREWDPAGTPFFHCGESGSTLRFMIPIALALAGAGSFTGRGRLMDRPQKPYFDIFEEKGISHRQVDGVLTVEGELIPGEYRLPGDVSSQFVTGLLYALPLLDGDSEIVLTSPLESASYVEMTLKMLETFGVQVERQGYERFIIPGGQVFSARDVTVEGDWSQAAFWYAAKALGNPVELAGLEKNSAQGDRVVAELFPRLTGEGELSIDLSDCPDLLPPLAVMAAARKGTTRFTGAARLRIKESDRLATVHSLLAALGCPAEEGPDSLTVSGRGPGSFAGGTVDGANDHRIVMAAAVAATACQGPVTILGAQAVEKSYPAFWRHYKDLGVTSVSSEFGKLLKVSVFGQSHGTAIGVVVDGLPAGEAIDLDRLDAFPGPAQAGEEPPSTSRQEGDVPEFLSGLENGVTCGSPLCAVIRNSGQRSGDYRQLEQKPRPGHADYTAAVKWDGQADMRGGGHFSGRLTAPLCVAGGIAKQILARKGVFVGAHLLSVGGVWDQPFPLWPTAELFESVAQKPFPVLDDGCGEGMQQEILAAKEARDSVGGIIQCAAIGVPAGLGDPMFDGMENRLAAALFGIPGIKGVEFGAGFEAAKSTGSRNNDPFVVTGGRVCTETNRAGGILGGITTGMPVVLQAAVKPTPSIAREQKTVDLAAMEETELAIQGRHDPCIAHRAVPVVEAVTALVLLDLLLEGNHGTF